jgi:hypothetical protein
MNTLDVTEGLLNISPVVWMSHCCKTNVWYVSVHEVEDEVGRVLESVQVLSKPDVSYMLKVAVNTETFAAVIVIDQRLLSEAFLRIDSLELVIEKCGVRASELSNIEHICRYRIRIK